MNTVEAIAGRSESASEVASMDAVIDALRERAVALQAIDGVVAVRPGLKFGGAEQPDVPAIVVSVRPGADMATIPREVAGLPVDVRLATPDEIVSGVLPRSAWEGFVPEAKPQIGYEPPHPNTVKLKEVDIHDITCHVGPDSGWSTLKPFLEATRETLTVAMYEFYAEHIIKAIAKLGAKKEAKLNMILQVSANDVDAEQQLSAKWGTRLKFTRASVSGPGRIFNNSYHTKVAVRDSSAIWLSSGNWSPNSQPDVGPGFEQVLYTKGNREWHVIINDDKLARMFEKFIEHDIDQARAVQGTEAAEAALPDLLVPISALQAEAAVLQDHPFEARTFAQMGKAVRCKPLMSPDNYAQEILELINGAQESLYLQFSYIRQPSGEIFGDIVDAITRRMREGLDVRVLVSSSQKAEHSELLVAKRKWKRSMFRRQTSKMHNKGVLVDGRIAVVGSNNWSTDGTQYNRDASLVFFDEDITAYFTEIFLFDWDRLSKPISQPQEVTPLVAGDGPTPLGMVRIPWRAWYED
jgi:phosphatidylserine/phosphatidylglycerophosphate/cardiolipin synthase-like enzyme